MDITPAAVKITEENREKIAFANLGMIPDVLAIGDYFVQNAEVRADGLRYNAIYSEEEFRGAFVFAQDEDETHLVDVDEI